MAKQPTPWQEFKAQVAKALRAFYVGAVGTAGTVVGTVFVTGDLDKVKELDPFAVLSAAFGAGLVAAGAVYRKANAGAKYQSPQGGLEPQSVPHRITPISPAEARGVDPFVDDTGTADQPAPAPFEPVVLQPADVERLFAPQGADPATDLGSPDRRA